MEQMEALEARVWQRVGGGQPMELPQLCRLCREAAADYRALASGSGGEVRQTLLTLHRDAAFAAQTVAGMAVLRGLALPGGAVCCQRQQQRRGIALAYRRSRELWEQFRAWSASGEFGFAFRALTRQEENTGMRLLALLAACPIHSEGAAAPMSERCR